MQPQLAKVVNAAVVNIAAALLAAYIVGQMPELKAWIRAPWDVPGKR